MAKIGSGSGSGKVGAGNGEVGCKAVVGRATMMLEDVVVVC